MAVCLFQGARILGSIGELRLQRAAVRLHRRQVAFRAARVGAPHFFVQSCFRIVAGRFLRELGSYLLVLGGCGGIGDACRNLTDRWDRGACREGQKGNPGKNWSECNTHDLLLCL